MIALVTKADLDNFKYIADSIKNATTWPQFVSEAQLLDIKAWLTDALLLEIVGQASTSTTHIFETFISLWAFAIQSELACCS